MSRCRHEGYSLFALLLARSSGRAPTKSFNNSKISLKRRPHPRSWVRGSATAWIARDRMTSVIETHTVYELGPFRLDTEAQVLTHHGVATALGARGVAVLAALVSRAGQYVERSVIVDAAWPGLVVEEANLTVQVSAIRRVLARVPDGERWIETLTRRGYRFVGPVTRLPDEPTAGSIGDARLTSRGAHEPTQPKPAHVPAPHPNNL